MAVNSRQHPLEIPPPSAKDWPKEEEENFFLLDPDRKRDVLPQPFRMIHKLVMQVFESAVEIIEEREMLREAQKRKVQPTKCFPTAEFQVTERANCLAVSGKYIFVGLSVGLAAFSRCDLKDVCAWDAAQKEICALHASALGNECHVLLAVDEMGQCALGVPGLAEDELCSGPELPQSRSSIREAENVPRKPCREGVGQPADCRVAEWPWGLVISRAVGLVSFGAQQGQLQS
uniref:WD repeat domain 93 n=1 Tax=Zonotrichia albicollis TaxID=44394 RepID=A0A8D2QAC2_ZONAL